MDIEDRRLYYRRHGPLTSKKAGEQVNLTKMRKRVLAAAQRLHNKGEIISASRIAREMGYSSTPSGSITARIADLHDKMGYLKRIGEAKSVTTGRKENSFRLGTPEEIANHVYYVEICECCGQVVKTDTESDDQGTLPL